MVKRDKGNQFYVDLNHRFYSLAIHNIKFSLDNINGIVGVWQNQVIPQLEEDLKKLEKVKEIINNDYWDWENYSMDDIEDLLDNINDDNE